MTNDKTPFISVIIPNFNDAATLPACLKSVLASNYSSFEIIVIDDKSTDHSVEIISSYPVQLIKQSVNQGQGVARNVGAEHARGDILLFIDADVVIYKDTLQELAQLFAAHPDVASVVGILDETCPLPQLPCIHFNSRIRFEYLKLPESINIFYGAIGAVKKDIFHSIGGFNKTIKGVEDSELGLRLIDYGHKIHHSKSLMVSHHKKISFGALLVNDFKRTVDRVKLVFGRKMFRSLVETKVIISTHFYQCFSPLFMLLFLVTFILGLYFHAFLVLSLACLVIFMLINAGYLRFMYNRFDIKFVIKLFLLLLCDMTVIAFAVMWGGISVLRGKTYT